MSTDRFWETKTLQQFSPEEWERLCDGCAKCCLHKLEDEDTSEIHLTNVCCQYLDLHHCRCGDYQNRHSLVPTCVVLTPENLPNIDWLPATCAYGLIRDGKPLPEWHHLNCGDPDRIHALDKSVMHWATPETEVVDIFEHIITEWD